MTYQSFILSTFKPTKKFIFLNSESYINILRVSIVSPQFNQPNQYISRIIGDSRLDIKLSESVDKENEWIKNINPIYLVVNPNQFQPIFEINKQIKTELISINSPNDSFYKNLDITFFQVTPNTDLEIKIDVETYLINEVI